MAKRPSTDLQGVPNAEPQGAPRDLHPIADIRFVITEIAKLTERVEHFSSKLDELKTDGRETRDRLFAIEKGISFVKGAMWVFGGLFAIIVVLVGVVARSIFGN